MKALKNVIIYTKDHCPFCARVKSFLTSNKVEFKQIRVDEDPKGYMELRKKQIIKLFHKFLWMDNSLAERKSFLNGCLAKM